MNNHAEIQRRLPAYCGGELEPAERRQVDRHLAECPSCRAALADLQTALRLIRSTPEVDPPPWMTARIMARIREQQTGKRSWLQRLFFPLHIKLPLEAAALLMVCVSGFYLTRTVETSLEQAARQRLQEPPAQQALPPAQAPGQLPVRGEATEPSAAPPPQGAFPPASAPHPAPRLEGVPADTPSFAPAAPAPPPPAFRDQQGGKAEAMKAVPAAESGSNALESAPEMKSKSSRSDATAPAPARRAAGAPAIPPLHRAMIRLEVDNPSAAPAMVREALLRSGGVIIDEHGVQGQSLRVRIPAARQDELLQRLERLGRIPERPAAAPANAQMLELTILW